VFAKNKRGYRLTAKSKRFWSLLILFIFAASIKRKLLKTTYTEERPYPIQIQKVATFNSDRKRLKLIQFHTNHSDITNNSHRLFFWCIRNRIQVIFHNIFDFVFNKKFAGAGFSNIYNLKYKNITSGSTFSDFSFALFLNWIHHFFQTNPLLHCHSQYHPYPIFINIDKHLLMKHLRKCCTTFCSHTNLSIERMFWLYRNFNFPAKMTMPDLQRYP